MASGIRLTAVLFAVLVLAGCKDSEPAVVDVDDDNPVMNQAIADARASVDRFITALESGSPNKLGISVKTQIEEDGQGEHLWLTSVSYADGSFSGEINNTPQLVTAVKLGDRVSVPKEEISDWMYIEDGRLVGGYTIRALVELTPPDQLPDFPFVID